MFDDVCSFTDVVDARFLVYRVIVLVRRFRGENFVGRHYRLRVLVSGSSVEPANSVLVTNLPAENVDEIDFDGIDIRRGAVDARASGHVRRAGESIGYKLSCTRADEHCNQ